MQHLTTPVLILGAGPAGASASIFLSKAGIPHIIADKAVFPRDKVCGDACSGKTVYVLRTANPAWLQEIHDAPGHFTRNQGISFIAPNGMRMDVPYKPNRQPPDPVSCFSATRLHFDNFLFEKLPSEHATILQGISPLSLKRQPNGQVLLEAKSNDGPLAITADMIIGADGDKSLVRKTLLPAHQADKSASIGLRAYYQGVGGMHQDDFIELHFLKPLLPGYLWIFPMPGGMANVGVGMPSALVRKKNINLRELMLHTLKHHPELKERFANAALTGKIQGWGLPMGGSRLPVSGEGFMLAGDAASLIDPFSGEGIGNALYSGMKAAQAATAAVAQNRFDAAFLREQYDRPLYNRLGSELRLSATLQRLCRYPWLFNLVVRKAAKSAELQQTISGMFADLDLRARLRDPRFYLNILLNK